MQRLSLARLAIGLALLLLAAGAQEVRAQAPEKVRFDTFDRVTLRGLFYPSSKGTKAPCVLLLHAVGGNAAQEGWDSLAKSLQQKGFAVLAFDFRGHGDSREVDPTVFWNAAVAPENQKLRSFKAGKPPSEINYKDFTTLGNYLTLVNDIAAAKRFLDTRNDSQDCNSANVFLIGAESGATLGAIWIATEWQRRTGDPLIAPAGKTQVAGQDIAGAIWLSITPALSKLNVNIDACFRHQPVKDKIPTYFIYGAQDTKAEKYAYHVYNEVLRAKVDKKLAKNTGVKRIDNTKLAGRELLLKSLPTEKELILPWLEKVLQDSGTNAWERRDTAKTRLFPVPYGQFVR